MKFRERKFAVSHSTRAFAVPSKNILVSIKFLVEMARHLTLTIFLASLVLIYANVCKEKCGEHESNDICGKSCEPSCKLRDFIAVQCITCTESSRGCRCEQGFLRDEETGYCVSPENCTPSCDEGETYLACGTTCEGTCTHPYEPEICTRIRCSQQGCRCDLNKGYVRDTISKKCIAIDNCPIS